MITVVVSEQWVCFALALLVMAGCWIWTLWDFARNPLRRSPLFEYPWVLSILERPGSWDLEALNRDYVPDTGQPRPWE